MIKFEIIFEDKMNIGQVIFSEDDNSFDFEPTLNSDINIAIAYLNLGFDSETMTAQQVWGFSPKESWTNMKLEDNITNVKRGKLKLLGEYEAGLTYRIDKDNTWKATFDLSSGCYCIGDYKINTDTDMCVEFATNTIAVIDNGELKAIWLKPLIRQ